MPLQISKTNARVLERLDIQIGASTLTLVEGADPNAPLDLILNKPDHANIAEQIAVADLFELADAVTSLASTIQGNRNS